MTKKYKLLTKATMTAALATAAFVPAAVASADTSTSVQQVVFEVGGKTLKLSLTDYALALSVGDFDRTQAVKYIVTNNGTAYSLTNYALEYTSAGGDVAKAFQALETSNSAVALPSIEEGKIVGGKVVAKDETPEEKVNETFFYNLAA